MIAGMDFTDTSTVSGVLQETMPLSASVLLGDAMLSFEEGNGVSGYLGDNLANSTLGCEAIGGTVLADSYLTEDVPLYNSASDQKNKYSYVS